MPTYRRSAQPKPPQSMVAKFRQKKVRDVAKFRHEGMVKSSRISLDGGRRNFS